jgi:hypothetical protein
MLILTTETVFVWFSLGFEAHGFDPLDISLKLSNATFRLLILFMGFVWLAEQTLVHLALALRSFVLGLFFFCFNAPFQFTPRLKLRSLIFGLTPFDWLRSVTLNPYS